MSGSDNEITIEQIVDSFSARLETGERPSIEEYKRRYPQFADRIEAILPALIMLENVDSDPGERKLAVDDSIPEMLGEYQIIQEVGRGGMGIVFEAQHTTMRRRVALKVLPKSSAEKPNYLRRFHVEARSAGQLHHTNIVPVFEVGESQGLHYYSMQYIHGDNLDHVIDEIRILRQQSHNNHLDHTIRRRNEESHRQFAVSRSVAAELVAGGWSGDRKYVANGKAISSTLDADGAWKHEGDQPDRDARAREPSKRDESRTTVFTQTTSSVGRDRNEYHNRVASVGVQIANALAYAHEHGVLHRDVKPANLILDTEGNVWITDFGLAKLDTNDMTQTGDIVGTLRYMAPERFAGEADPRSDIYSLGLTLYELCTLKCAFENDRGTLVQDVAGSNSVVSPRKIDETIPSDLETIILKAIEPQPERRYQSAVELADDLALFLADRPINARRATWAEKCWRICRRNPVASSLASCLTVLLILVTAGSIQLARAEARQRKESQRSLFYSKVDQAKMRRYSGRPGQRFEAMRAVRVAVDLLPEMQFNQEVLQQTRFQLRGEVVAANSLTDIEKSWSHTFEPGWGGRMRCAIDPSGKYFAEGHDEGRIRIRKVVDQDIVLELPPGRGVDPAWVMKFCPHGKYLITKYHQPNVHDEFLTVIWDLQSGGEPVYVTRHTHQYCFSKDSNVIAIGYVDRIELVRLEDGEVINTVYPDFSPHGKVNQVCLNENATRVAVSQSGTGVVEFWNVTRHPVLTQTVECESAIFSMDWDSRRQIFVAGAHRGLLYYWTGDLWSAPETIRLHQNSIFRTHLHPTYELVATSAWDATTRFTDLVAGREVIAVEDHILPENGFCANGRIGLRSPDEEIGVWDVALPLVEVYSAPAAQGGFTCCIHPNYHNIVARSVGTGVEIWNTDNRKRLWRIEDVGAIDIKFSNCGTYLFISGANGLSRWNASCDGQNVDIRSRKKLIEQATGCIDLSRQRPWLLVAAGSQISILNYESAETIRQIGIHNNLLLVRFTADERHVLSGTWKGKGIKIWDTDSGEWLQTVNAETASVDPVPHPVDPNRFFSGRFDTAEFSIKKNNPPGTRVPASEIRKLNYDGTIEMTPDGQLMAVQTNSFTLVLLETDTQQEMATIVSAGQSRIVDKAFSQDGETLVLACFDNLQVIDMKQVRQELSKLDLDW